MIGATLGKYRIMRRPLLLLLCISVLATAMCATVVAAAAPTFFWHPEIAPRGPVVIVVSLEQQRLYAYRNGVAIGVSPVSSGKPGYETPAGIYTILQKARTHFSNLYDDAPMPFMQRLTWDGVALHAGVVRSKPASHGCIRLPEAFAARLFGITRAGDVVVVSDAHEMPASVRFPAAVAPIDLSGRPSTAAAGRAPAWLTPRAEGGPLSVVVSLHDRAVYVMQAGELIGRAPLALAGAPPLTGSVLYVMHAGGDGTAHAWGGYRIRGHGAVPVPAQLAHELALPPAFGHQLQLMLAVGTTVLVTDLPGVGGRHDQGMRALLESDPVDSSRER
jgi:hypothetical protein